MSNSLLSLFIVTVLFAGAYFWYAAETTCPIPIAYHVGQVDARFAIDEAEARSAIDTAIAMWEEATGLDLFVEEPGVGLPVNFLFDERQQFTNAEEQLSYQLDKAREVNEAVEAEYNELVDTYNDLQVSYETRRSNYENNLNEYNSEVARWNEEGGAPQSVFEELNDKKEALDREQTALANQRTELNNLVDKINALNERANSIIDSYNKSVAAYNDTFSESTEFTQGDFQGDRINIYQFKSTDELTLVLAHELGHALGMDHVENEASIMYMQMGGQTVSGGLSSEDLASFVEVCGDGSLLSKIKIW